MKLNKLFFSLFSVIVLIGFSSCGSDDDDDITKENIVGKWLFVDAKTDLQTNKPAFDKFVREYKPEGEVTPPTEPVKTIEITYEFTAKGKYTYRFDDKEVARGSYTIKDNTITINANEGGMSNTYTFSGSTKKLFLEMDTKKTFQGFFNYYKELGLLKDIDVKGIKVEKMTATEIFKRISDK